MVKRMKMRMMTMRTTDSLAFQDRGTLDTFERRQANVGDLGAKAARSSLSIVTTSPEHARCFGKLGFVLWKALNEG